mmetsp:Transcript_20350/g.44216  ORF Transcript_20350/g.44216 Transcript_20350/m.44216 type:complete len:539 (+) Transcript_20350:142-1758(+)|eukprot:CAMPEP_0172325072 /NCGR_PEP_ID=MMETSP1058-20130122/53080_1 /TAXON_ID=83371 /ORGANISM="Detonula confervacea, Strain CCMP 353" /LENGTH=538 /DNA_ID=CAMNT_0013041523 /DNA_START=100 /DNA_END=1716 /DNA_ORIENTATION=+
MNPISAFIVASISVAFWPCPAAADACIAFSNVQLLKSIRTQKQLAPVSPRSIPPPLSCPGTNGHASNFNQRTRHSVSHLHLSKYTENVIEEEPIIKNSPDKTANGSPTNTNGESVESNNQIDSINGNQQLLSLFNIDPTNSERSLGILVLLTVPLAWGTYTPVVKYMYEKMDPSMPGFVFSAGYYLVAAASLGILSNRSQDDDSKDEMVVENDGQLLETMNGNEDENDEASITTRGGWELGSYLFIGNGLQVVGLQTVPADRAAFLVQLTTVMVPLVSALSAGKLSAVPLPTWIGCIIAFVGVIVMGADDRAGGDSVAGGDGSEAIEGVLSTTGIDHHAGASFFDSVNMDQLSSSFQMSQGDILIVLAAVSYTMHVVRLGAYAPRTTPLKLAASKASTEAFLSVFLVAALAFIGSTHFPSPEFVSETGSSVSEYFTTIISAFTEGGLSNQNENSLGVSIAAILWTGWVTCAYTIYAQSFGQRRVNPTDSNLIYTMQPLFSSLFAYFLLGETLGFYGYVGATLIGAALLLVTLSDDDDS